MRRIFLNLYVVCLICGLGATYLLSPLLARVLDPFADEESRRATVGFFHLLQEEFREVPVAQWQSHLETLRPYFGCPLSLGPCAALELSAEERDQLEAGAAVVKQNGDLFHFRLLDSDQAFTVGPVASADLSGPATLAYWSYIFGMIALPGLVWVLPFSFNLRRISRAADAFGHGRLDARARVPKLSSLRPLAHTFNTMASRIESLVASHKELTNAVSHELRTPLARLKFGVEMLDETALKRDRERYLRGLRQDIDEIDALVEELLIYARFDRVDPMPEDLPRLSLVGWLTDLVSEESRSRDVVPIHLETDALDRTIEVRMEPRHLDRAVRNVTRNAQRYARTSVRVSAALEGPNCAIHVDDDGPGVPPDQRQRILEPFTRLDRSRDRRTGGHGLGLAIVSRIMAWHHGTVQVTESPLGGARFTLRWPAHPIVETST